MYFFDIISPTGPVARLLRGPPPRMSVFPGDLRPGAQSRIPVEQCGGRRRLRPGQGGSPASWIESRHHPAPSSLRSPPLGSAIPRCERPLLCRLRPKCGRGAIVAGEGSFSGDLQLRHPGGSQEPSGSGAESPPGWIPGSMDRQARRLPPGQALIPDPLSGFCLRL